MVHFDRFESRSARRRQLARDIQDLMRRPDFRKPWTQAKELLDLQLHYLGLNWKDGDTVVICQVWSEKKVYYMDMHRRSDMEITLVGESRYAHQRHADFPLWMKALREKALLKMSVEKEAEAVKRFALYDAIMDNLGPKGRLGEDYKNLRNPMDFLAIQPYGCALPEEFRNLSA